MIEILSNPNFIKLKTNEYYPINCSFCKKEFLKDKKHLKYKIKNNDFTFFCSSACKGHFINPGLQTNCAHCLTPIIVMSDKITGNKSGNYFCTRSHAATYNNTHKKFGTRKSKLEIWLESKLSIIYPNLEILYTSKEAINSELDIYIPSLNLAFELNGIYHYEPIHGQDKLNQIQNNDHRKFQACLEKGIELCIIDTSQHKYVKESTNLKYLEIIQNIINLKLI